MADFIDDIDPDSNFASAAKLNGVVHALEEIPGQSKDGYRTKCGDPDIVLGFHQQSQRKLYEDDEMCDECWPDSVIS